jgi:hypothetical protein
VTTNFGVGIVANDGSSSNPALERLMDEVISAPTTVELLVGVYRVVLPEVIAACKRLKNDAHPLADAPTVRVAKLMEFELADLVSFGDDALACLEDDKLRQANQPWTDHLRACLQAAGRVDATEESSDQTPDRWHSKTPYEYEYEPRRDERFRDPFNAGVNPEAFLYDERFSPRDKTLMMYYKRLREIDVPEMMASILVDLRDEEPWEFHMEMSRQLWDEARHAMMGEVGFVSLGIDWRQIPINFTWSRNLNLQLDARERHGVLFFIEQGLMPRTGKRYEWEVATESGDPLSALFQDFDWADEVLHAQIGRRWYVPRYKSLQDSLEYGDRCWSKVLSHWRDYRDQGLTEHRNWWPDLYRKACAAWDQTPDPQALAFCETYEDSRAFVPIWRIVSNRGEIDQSKLLAWVQEQVSQLLPHNLRLALDVADRAPHAEDSVIKTTATRGSAPGADMARPPCVLDRFRDRPANGARELSSAQDRIRNRGLAATRPTSCAHSFTRTEWL